MRTCQKHAHPRTQGDRRRMRTYSLRLHGRNGRQVRYARNFKRLHRGLFVRRPRHEWLHAGHRLQHRRRRRRCLALRRGGPRRRGRLRQSARCQRTEARHRRSRGAVAWRIHGRALQSLRGRYVGIARGGADGVGSSGSRRRVNRCECSRRRQGARGYALGCGGRRVQRGA